MKSLAARKIALRSNFKKKHQFKYQISRKLIKPKEQTPEEIIQKIVQGMLKIFLICWMERGLRNLENNLQIYF
jgi:ribosomal protein L13